MTCAQYGSADVLHVTDIAPPQPRADEVLIRVAASSLNKGDWHIMRGSPWVVRLMFGLKRPKKVPVLGGDVAGVVEAAGSDIKRFQVGDTVFGDLTAYRFGAWAEFVCSDEKSLCKMPEGVAIEQAACMGVSGITALQALRDHGQLKSNQRVLINGASGSVGQLAVQIAKAMGAHVTASGRTQKLAMLDALGADQVIDYTQHDITQPDEPYDLIIDAAAYQSFSRFRSALTPGGRYVLVGGTFGQLIKNMLFGKLISKIYGRTFITMLAKSTPDDLNTLAEFMADGKLIAIIDRRYTIEEIPKAMRRLERREALGKLVIKIA